MEKHLALKYKAPAEDSAEGWEKYSLPVGNGFGGASVFGGVAKERIQFTTKQLRKRRRFQLRRAIHTNASSRRAKLRARVGTFHGHGVFPLSDGGQKSGKGGFFQLSEPRVRL